MLFVYKKNPFIEGSMQNTCRLENRVENMKMNICGLTLKSTATIPYLTDTVPFISYTHTRILSKRLPCSQFFPMYHL